jgi:hypothetical protein
MNEDQYIRDSVASVKQSIEIADEILRLCYLSLESGDKTILSRLGKLLGDFSNQLRSSLNDYSKAVLTERQPNKSETKKFEELGGNIEFPWAQDKTEFDKKPVIRAVKEVSENLYNAYEQLQPYYANNDWLAQLMILSYRDNHEIVNQVESPNVTGFTGFVSDGSNLETPKFEGDKLLMPSLEGVITAQLPFYFAPLHAFATKEHTWSIFLVPMKERFNLDLIDFTQTTPIKVVKILSTLDTRFGTYFAELFKDEVENQVSSHIRSSS